MSSFSGESKNRVIKETGSSETVVLISGNTHRFEIGRYSGAALTACVLQLAINHRNVLKIDEDVGRIKPRCGVAARERSNGTRLRRSIGLSAKLLGAYFVAFLFRISTYFKNKCEYIYSPLGPSELR
jgi:hypothetical protein